MDFNFKKLIIMTTEKEFLSAYEKIKAAHKATMSKIDEAISHDEQEQFEAAITAYTACIESIDDTFRIPVGLPEDIDAVATEWSDACTIIQNLKSAKAEISYRLKVIRTKMSPLDETATEADEENQEPLTKKKSNLLENPSTFYDIKNASGTSRTYTEIINGLRQVIATKDSGVSFDTLFQSAIKLYKIHSNGVVSSIAGETSMSLVMCNVGGMWKYLDGMFFIQCDFPMGRYDSAPSTSVQALENQNLIWLYPLIPNVTVCYRTEYGAFILPDMEANTPGNTFGIMLIEPPTAEESEKITERIQLTDREQFFLDLLEAVLAVSVEEIKEKIVTQGPSDVSQQVSKQIVTTADFIARNLIRSAEKTGELMFKGTPYIISKMSPAQTDTPVSSTVQTSVEVAKNVTGVAASVTGWMASKVGAASMAVGRYLAPHVQTHGATLLEKSFGYNSNEANQKMENALTIVAGTVEGFSTVFNGLETSAKILGNSLSNNSVKIIEHKYGASAGNVAAGTFDTIGNAFNVSQNVNYITPKGIAKKMVKNTGKAVIIDYKPAINDESQFIPAGALYPDLRNLKEKHI